MAVQLQHRGFGGDMKLFMAPWPGCTAQHSSGVEVIDAGADMGVNLGRDKRPMLCTKTKHK